MVQAIVRIDEDTNRVLNIVKAKYGLKDKSQAINIMAQQYKEELLEPELRPQYIDKLKKLEKQKGIPFKNSTQLRRIIEG
jgi:antitoxin component of RelBE/YafQ-DinJ toxin-antitoxin module